MSDKEIREMLNVMGYGENPPSELMAVIARFLRVKCALSPIPFEISDLSACVSLYEEVKKLHDEISKFAKKREKKDNV